MLSLLSLPSLPSSLSSLLLLGAEILLLEEMPWNSDTLQNLDTHQNLGISDTNGRKNELNEALEAIHKKKNDNFCSTLEHIICKDCFLLALFNFLHQKLLFIMDVLHISLSSYTIILY